MNQIETLKAQAKNLKHAMTKMGMAISLAQALEAVAQQYGLDNWDTLAGIVNKAHVAAAVPPGLGSLPGMPYKVELKGCSGLHVECTVKLLDMAALALVHDEVKLQRHVLANPKRYLHGLGTTAIHLTDGIRDFQFTLHELIGIKSNNDDWHLTGGLVALRFHCHEDRIATLAPKVELDIPQMVKSAKGCRLVILSSHDGAKYDRHVIVPPHLDATLISEKIRAEICRLKEIDAAHEEDENYGNEYTEEDLWRFVGSIGCLWVSEPVVVGENWD